MREKNKGLLTLEAAIVIPMFMMIMLFLYSLMLTVIARDQVAHALVNLAQVVSVREYAYSKLNSSTTWSTGQAPDSGVKTAISNSFGGVYDTVDQAINWVFFPDSKTATVYDDYYHEKFDDRRESLNSEFSEALREADFYGNNIDGWGILADDDENPSSITAFVNGSIKPVFDFWGFGVTTYHMEVTTKVFK